MSLLNGIKSAPLATARIALVALGLLLSIVSAAGWCSIGGCSATHDYVIYSVVPVAVFGIAFFVWLGILELAAWRYGSEGIVGSMRSVSLAAALGAEGIFLLIQRNVIGSYCIVCVAIALIVIALANIRAYEFIKSFERSMVRRVTFWLSLLGILAAFLFGFLLILAGSPSRASDIKAAVSTAELQSDLFIGAATSKTEVLVFEDWFCPGCVAVEPEIAAAIVAIGSKARVMRVTLPIHPESINYVPYDALFASRYKDKYPELRAGLMKLAESGVKSPTFEQVQSTVAQPLGASVAAVNMLDSYRALAIYTVLAQQHEVRSTPTIVVRSGGYLKTISGSKEITKAAVIAAVDEAVAAK